jgi:hypothetical protein
MEEGRYCGLNEAEHNRFRSCHSRDSTKNHPDGEEQTLDRQLDRETFEVAVDKERYQRQGIERSLARVKASRVENCRRSAAIRLEEGRILRIRSLLRVIA